MRDLGIQTRFIELADVINSAMPHWWVGRIQDALNEHGKPLKGARILLLGVAYKKDIDDLRESPALPIIEELRARGAAVTYNDPYVPTLRLGDERLESAGLTKELLQWADCVGVHTDHSSYDWNWIGAHAQVVVDTRNAMTALGARTDALGH
jgi:UDP-N-acetyl-D-glucosamine dehydrogenase